MRATLIHSECAAPFQNINTKNSHKGLHGTNERETAASEVGVIAL